MSRRFLFPCTHCEQSFPIETPQAGNQAACPHCGAQVTLPTFKEIRSLPPAEEQAGQTASAAYAPWRGALFIVGVVLLVGSLALIGFMGFKRSQLNTNFSTEDDVRSGNQVIDAMSYDEIYMAWDTLTDEGLGPKLPLMYLEEQKSAAMMERIMIGAGVAGAVGLALMAGSLLGRR